MAEKKETTMERLKKHMKVNGPEYYKKVVEKTKAVLAEKGKNNETTDKT